MNDNQDVKIKELLEEEIQNTFTESREELREEAKKNGGTKFAVITQLELRLSKLEPYFDEFNAIQFDIETLTGDNEPLSELNEREKFETMFFDWVTKARVKIATLRAGFELRKWQTNVPNLVNKFEVHNDKLDSNIINLSDKQTSKTLGIYWDPNSDVKRRHLSAPEVAQLVTLVQEGHTYRDVGNRLGVSSSVVSRAYNRYRETTGFDRRAGQGRRRVTTRRDDRIIVRRVRQQPFVHAHVVAQDFPNRQQQQQGRRRPRNISRQTVQAVCDSKRKIRDVFIGFPGSVHDGRVFRNSTLCNTLEGKCGEKYILGDSAYLCLRNLITPYKNRRPLTPMEVNFNKKLSHVRVRIEHTFGLLKQKFRQLYHLKLRGMVVICHFIRAYCVLYNLSSADEDEEMDWQQFEEIVTLKSNKMSLKWSEGTMVKFIELYHSHDCSSTQEIWSNSVPASPEFVQHNYSHASQETPADVISQAFTNL
ncbi:hypothetical protein NQ314_020486 [Rhamnusium bicolor]|uniref:DDE Tnp4 domain-containing protein n=1 Tax=Rhamnusium bicolor TaxID=1586634 RepID=A0AAV8WKV9_9CUCU|nr:hypothetical protein NQ314_020486 [Rhamnusium bicolor]